MNVRALRYIHKKWVWDAGFCKNISTKWEYKIVSNKSIDSQTVYMTKHCLPPNERLVHNWKTWQTTCIQQKLTASYNFYIVFVITTPSLMNFSLPSAKSIRHFLQNPPPDLWAQNFPILLIDGADHENHNVF